MSSQYEVVYNNESPKVIKNTDVYKLSYLLSVFVTILYNRINQIYTSN